MAAEAEVIELAYKEGALSSKIKRLIAMAFGLKVGCTNCILAQTEKALAEGATKDEILETLQVLVAMGGTTGIAESLRVIKFLDELGHL
jgi:AhpD family alkylhydroperoxidase